MYIKTNLLVVRIIVDEAEKERKRDEERKQREKESEELREKIRKAKDRVRTKKCFFILNGCVCDAIGL